MFDCNDDYCEIFPSRSQISRGTVTKTLNVREIPDHDSDIIGIIKPGEEFDIDNEESTKKFCKIYTDNGIEGFVIRQYVRKVG